jgi:hypothetical protein
MAKYGKPTKNKRGIDPRYFLNETVDRESLEEGGAPPGWTCTETQCIPPSKDSSTGATTSQEEGSTSTSTTSTTTTKPAKGDKKAGKGVKGAIKKNLEEQEDELEEADKGWSKVLAKHRKSGRPEWHQEASKKKKKKGSSVVDRKIKSSQGTESVHAPIRREALKRTIKEAVKKFLAKE